MSHHFTPASPLTLALQDHDFTEWRRGRERYAIWMIDADVSTIRERAAQTRAHLDGSLSIHQRSLHITLFVCGFWVDNAHFNDDFNLEMLDRQRCALAAAAISPFSLRIGGLDSFDLAPFLRVNDPSNSLQRLRIALAQDCAEIRQMSYVAHVTIGTYAKNFDKSRMSDQLSSFGQTSPINLQVSRIHFATYAARSFSGPFDLIESLPLI